MRRVLQCVNSMEFGGIQAFIMNVYRNIDREEIQFDFLLHNKPKKNYDDEIVKLGGRIFYLPPRSEGIIKNKIALRDFFKNHREYDIVHMHESSLSYIEPLLAAQKAGVPVRIIHSHSSNLRGNKIHRILHRINSKRIHWIANIYLACGKVAGDWMFGQSNVRDKYEILHNGIDLASFEFSDSVRLDVRNELGIKNEFLIGHVGRFMEVKNHKMILDIFKEVLSLKTNSKLVLVGQGELFDSIKEYAKRLKIENNILFLGIRNDVARIIQAMDAMVMPSLYEGFPVTAIEAQASGLPVFLADTITTEACIKENVHIIGLDQLPKIWARQIVSENRRIIDNGLLYKLGFDIKDVVERITEIYSF